MDIRTIINVNPYITGIILTEALTHAVRSWEILDPIRNRITRRFNFTNRLLNCFECTSVWIAAAVIAYLYFLDFWPITYTIIFQRLATILNIGIQYLDALRATTTNKI